jgi:rRNA maturation protein Nop10
MVQIKQSQGEERYTMKEEIIIHEGRKLKVKK